MARSNRERRPLNQPPARAFKVDAPYPRWAEHELVEELPAARGIVGNIDKVDVLSDKVGVDPTGGADPEHHGHVAKTMAALAADDEAVAVASGDRLRR